MAMGHIGPVEEIIGDLPGRRFVVGCKRDDWSDAARDNHTRVTKKKNGGIYSLHGSRLDMLTCDINGVFQDGFVGSQVR